MKGLILNQSQQIGIETLITIPVTKLIENITSNDIHTRIVPCYRLGDNVSSDKVLLYKSVDVANQHYDYFKVNKVYKWCQLDIHSNSSDNLKSSGIWLIWTSQKGKLLAECVKKELELNTHEKVLSYQDNTLYTLKNSKSVNIIVEFGFYSNYNDIIHQWNNRCSFAKSISIGVNRFLDSGVL